MKIFFWGGDIWFQPWCKDKTREEKTVPRNKKVIFYKKRKISFVGVTAAMNILNMTFFGKIASEFFSLEIFWPFFKTGILPWRQYWIGSVGNITNWFCWQIPVAALPMTVVSSPFLREEYVIWNCDTDNVIREWASFITLTTSANQ